MRRVLVRTLLTALVPLALVTPVAGAATAATPFPHISGFKANVALPARQSLPGGVGANWVMVRELTQPCLLSDAQLISVPTPKTVDGGVLTAASDGGSIYDRKISWSIEVLAFGSPHGARAYVAKLAAAERRCRATATYTYALALLGPHRTITSKKVSFSRSSRAGWTGYRGVDQLRYSQPGHTERRIWSVLTRGNALVFVSVTVPTTKVSGAVEEHWRRTVQDRISTALVREG